jgi:photosystem II stability/assembly factor-like uncharacterized protein
MASVAAVVPMVAPALIAPAIAADWQRSAPAEGLHDLAAEPIAPARVFATGNLRGYRSLDGGVSFQSIFTLDDGNQRFVGDPSRAQVVFSTLPGGYSTRARLLRSGDGGTSWALHYLVPLVAERPNEAIMGFAPSDAPGVLALATHANTDRQFGTAWIHRSRDDGATWTVLPIADAGGQLLPVYPSVLRTPRGEPETLYLGGTGFFLSLDGGRTWERGGPPFDMTQYAASIYALTVLPPAAGAPAGAHTLLAALGQRVYRSDDRGRTWVDSSAGLSAAWVNQLSFDPAHPDTVYAATFGAGVYRSSDGGRHWSPFNAGLPPNDQAGTIVSDVVVADGAAIAGMRNGPFRCAAQDCASARVSTRVPVIEFHHAALDHYFMTANAAEASAIDAGSAGPGWARTGLTFSAWQWPKDAPVDAAQVYRYYGTPGRGPNSHFYTAAPTEIAAVSADPGWSLENATAFNVRLPAAQGRCVDGGTPVHRAYNDRYARNDSNHRYSTSLAALQPMTARGWLVEGVTFCAPD